MTDGPSVAPGVLHQNGLDQMRRLNIDRPPQLIRPPCRSSTMGMPPPVQALIVPPARIPHLPVEVMPHAPSRTTGDEARSSMHSEDGGLLAAAGDVIHVEGRQAPSFDSCIAASDPMQSHVTPLNVTVHMEPRVMSPHTALPEQTRQLVSVVPGVQGRVIEAPQRVGRVAQPSISGIHGMLSLVNPPVTPFLGSKHEPAYVLPSSQGIPPTGDQDSVHQITHQRLLAECPGRIVTDYPRVAQSHMVCSNQSTTLGSQWPPEAASEQSLPPNMVEILEYCVQIRPELRRLSGRVNYLENSIHELKTELNNMHAENEELKRIDQVPQIASTRLQRGCRDWLNLSSTTDPEESSSPEVTLRSCRSSPAKHKWHRGGRRLQDFVVREPVHKRDHWSRGNRLTPLQSKAQDTTREYVHGQLPTRMNSMVGQNSRIQLGESDSR